MMGDPSLRNVAVQRDAEDASPPGNYDNCVFRLCSKFSYRARGELKTVEKEIRAAKNQAKMRRALNLDLAKQRAANEAAQNAELLGKLQRCEGGAPVKYGDVVQLQHLSSGLFLGLHKTPAFVNPNARRVSLKRGATAGQFRIMPRFKVRSVGSVVYADDEVVLQSVKFETLFLGATGTAKNRHISAAASAPLSLRLPSALDVPERFEVNGSMELRSFTVTLYARFDQPGDRGALRTSFNKVRLYHPEGNAFINASADADKGEVLDALPGPGGGGGGGADCGSSSAAQRHVRAGGVPAHIPYFKQLEHGNDPSNPANLSAKAAWRFEPLDRSHAECVRWRTAVRIRHVGSSKCKKKEQRCFCFVAYPSP